MAITVKLENVKVEGYGLNLTPRQHPEWGKNATFRVDFDSEAESKFLEIFNKIKAQAPAKFIALKKEQAEANNSRFMLKEDEVIVKNPLVQATKGSKDNKQYLDWKRLIFTAMKFSENKAKNLAEEIIEQHKKDGLNDVVKDMTEKLSGDKPKPLAALFVELNRLRKLGKDIDADALIERCMYAADHYRTEKGECELPAVIEVKDGKTITTYKNKDGEEKPLYVSKDDIVNIIFDIYTSPSQKPGEENNTIVLRLKLDTIEIVKRNKEFSEYKAPETLDLDIDTDVKKPNVNKTTVATSTSTEKKSDINETVKEETKKVQDTVEKELSDIDEMLSDEDIQIED